MLKTILVGTGGRGRVWANRVHNNPDYLAVAYVNRTFQSREDKNICYKDLDKAVKEVEADAAIISLPSRLHYRTALKTLRNGLHTIIEKPMTITLSEAINLVKEAEHGNKKLMVAQNYRFLSTRRKIKEIIEKKIVGKPDYSILTHHRYRPDMKNFKMKYPLLTEMSIHHFDDIRSVFGVNAISVCAESWNPPWSRYNGAAAVTALIRLENNIRLSYCGSFVSQNSCFDWRIECSAGAIHLTDNGLYIIKPASAIKVLDISADRDDESVDCILQEFSRAVKEDSEPECSGKDNLQSLAMVFACIESVKKKKIVRLRQLADAWG